MGESTDPAPGPDAAKEVTVEFTSGPEAARLVAHRKNLELAVEIVRFKLWNVLTLEADGELKADGDESTLTVEQKAVATRILAEEEAGTISYKDLTAAVGMAKEITLTARPKCQVGCNGTGVVRRVMMKGGAPEWDACDCIWRANDKPTRKNVTVPGRQVTRDVGVEKDRLSEARLVLASAKARQEEACAVLDKKIEAARKPLAAFFEKKAKLSTAMEFAESRRDGYTQEAAAASKDADVQAEIVKAAQQAIRGSLLLRSEDLSGIDAERFQRVGRAEERKEAHVYLAIAEVALLAAYQSVDEYRSVWVWLDALRSEQQDIMDECKVLLAQLEADNKTATSVLAGLGVERGRIAKHHAPKIESAERRVNRLVYLTK